MDHSSDSLASTIYYGETILGSERIHLPAPVGVVVDTGLTEDLFDWTNWVRDMYSDEQSATLGERSPGAIGAFSSPLAGQINQRHPIVPSLRPRMSFGSSPLRRVAFASRMTPNLTVAPHQVMAPPPGFDDPDFSLEEDTGRRHCYQAKDAQPGTPHGSEGSPETSKLPLIHEKKVTPSSRKRKASVAGLQQDDHSQPATKSRKECASQHASEDPSPRRSHIDRKRQADIQEITLERTATAFVSTLPPLSPLPSSYVPPSISRYSTYAARRAHKDALQDPIPGTSTRGDDGSVKGPLIAPYPPGDARVRPSARYSPTNSPTKYASPRCTFKATSLMESTMHRRECRYCSSAPVAIRSSRQTVSSEKWYADRGAVVRPVVS
ncbi:hypothetical protein K474DRAFT_1656006 [Panus rudis PR-1116 ss-1]|nr:hypothetical protein K474DRAFT_1656006 [Panus rudis PR-1116 ss-1]